MKLYKFRSLDNIEFVLDIILNERLFCASYESLNDPLEGLFFSMVDRNKRSFRYRRYKSVEDLPAYNSDLKICSLSKSLTDIRMWSHYANGHTGVAIEIDFSNHKSDATKVNYEIGLKKHGVKILEGNAAPSEVLSYKTEHWEYEEEYRVIHADDYYSIEGRVSAIYLGIRVSDFHRKLLSKSIPQHIKLIPTALDKNEIVVNPLTVH